MTDDRKGLGDLISTATIAVLFIVILILVVFSAASYNYATDVQADNNTRRVLLSYVSSCVRDNSYAEITPADFDGAKGLSIREKGSDYERRIYMTGGRLYEEYAERGKKTDPEEALEIGETEIFEVNKVRKGLIEIRTDIGASYVKVREK